MWWNRPTIEGGSRARHTTLTFSAADLEALGTERYEHPDPRVQQRMEVLWLISQGETQARSGPLHWRASRKPRRPGTSRSSAGTGWPV